MIIFDSSYTEASSFFGTFFDMVVLRGHSGYLFFCLVISLWLAVDV
jgi:hypothetical protein